MQFPTLTAIIGLLCTAEPPYAFFNVLQSGKSSVNRALNVLLQKLANYKTFLGNKKHHHSSRLLGKQSLTWLGICNQGDLLKVNSVVLTEPTDVYEISSSSNERKQTNAYES